MPEQESLLDSDVIARLGGQPLLTRLPMEGNITGHHKSPHRGSSVEFAEYRNYVPGDDIRRLDWRVLARTDRYYLKEYEAETNLRCYLVLDCSGSMAFGSAGVSKLQYARKLIATLAYLTIKQGDAAGFVSLHSKKGVEIPPKRNPAHLQLVLDSLRETKADGDTSLLANLHDVAEKIRRRALVLVFSDFFCDVKGLLSCLQHLRFQKHDVGLFHLLDPQEINFEFDRPVRFEDLESSFKLITEPASIKQQYLTELNKYLEVMRLGCHEFNVEYRRIVTNMPYEKALADFLVQRAQLAAGRH